MSITVEAVYENGSLKLLEALPLKEHDKVRVTVHTGTGRAGQTSGLIRWTGDVETLERVANDPELDFGPWEGP